MASTPRSNGIVKEQSSKPAGSTIACVLAVDGGERLGKDWQHLSVSYVTAILRQLSNVHPHAEIHVAPMIINSLPPTSKRPLVLRPFRPVAQAMAELPGLLGGKGKQRESTSDQDYALLEGLLVASSILEAQNATQSYIILVSAQDIPNTNFWDEELPGTLPMATIWPEIGTSTIGLNDENEFNTSQGWQRLIQELARTRTHLCTITTRFLPRLEDLQRKVAAANNLPSQALPNLQNSEHAILLTGFQSGVPAHQPQQQQQKRPHADSLSETTTRDSKDGTLPPMTNGQNKRVKLSPNMEARKVSLDQPAKNNKPSKAVTPQQQQAQAETSDAGPMNHASRDSIDSSYLQQSPNKILLSLANSQGSSSSQGQGAIDASSIFQPQQEQIQELSQQQQGFSVYDIQQKREEVKSQMKQFLTSLSSMAKAKQFSMEQARAAAEQVRAEAVKKLQLLDRLEQQSSLSRSPNLSALGLYPSNNDGNIQQSPNAAFLQMQQMVQQQGGQIGGQSQQGQQPQQQSQQQQQNIQLPQQLQMQLQAQQQYQNQQNQQQQQNQNHNQQQQQQPPPFSMGHQRTASFSSTTSSSAYQPTPGQTYAQLQNTGSTTPSIPAQTPQPQSKGGNPPKLPQSPSKAPPVWSGPIQWSLVDPQTKQKRELAFYVDAIPMRSNAAVEMMNLQWPSTLEIAHISGMPMTELQKYASDNRIQVIQFVKASAAVVENMGMSMGQNDSLYKLLAKSLEDKSSVATIKLPSAGQNRGIVVVALPGQAKLVGLLFLHTTLPPRTPAGQQPDLEKQQQNQPQQPQQQQQNNVQSTQRTNSRSQDTQQMAPPLPSPSFQQQALQPFLQQMQMPQQYQQAQQNQLKTTPNALYAATFPQQATQQFNSPNFQGNIPLPPAQQMLSQGMGPMANNQFNFAMQPPQGNASNGQSQPMSDAQFQELLASLQK